MQELKDKLKEFGQVDQCRIISDQLQIKITKGFNNKFVNANCCLGVVLFWLEKYKPDGKSIIVTYQVEKDLFHLVLSI